MATRRLGVMGEELGRLQRLLENVLTFSSQKEKMVTGELVELEVGAVYIENSCTVCPVEWFVADRCPVCGFFGTVEQECLEGAHIGSVGCRS